MATMTSPGCSQFGEGPSAQSHLSAELGGTSVLSSVDGALTVKVETVDESPRRGVARGPKTVEEGTSIPLWLSMVYDNETIKGFLFEWGIRYLLLFEIHIKFRLWGFSSHLPDTTNIVCHRCGFWLETPPNESTLIVAISQKKDSLCALCLINHRLTILFITARSYWQRFCRRACKLFEKAITKKKRAELSNLRAALGHMSLCRTKKVTDLNLPPTEKQLCKVDFLDGLDKDIYNVLFRTVQATFEGMMENGDERVHIHALYQTRPHGAGSTFSNRGARDRLCAYHGWIKRDSGLDRAH